MKETLEITLPHDFVIALGRRHHGRKSELSQEVLLNARTEMSALYKAYKLAKKKLDYTLDVWWDKEQIERYQFSTYRKHRWYYAHRKLRSQEAWAKNLWKQMFILLTNTDGNYGQEFSTFGCVAPDEIFADFQKKYGK